MKRKLIKQGGGGGTTIYLPKQWVEKKNLKAGDEIVINEQDGQLLISSSTKNIKKETVFEVKGEYKKNIRLIIKQLYRQGYERITFKYQSEKQYRIIESIVEDEYLGVEVTDKKKNQCTVESIIEAKEEKFEIFLRKMFQIIQHTMTSIRERSNEVSKLTRRLSAYQNFGKMVVANKRKDLIGYEYYSLLSYLLNIQADLAKLDSELKLNKAQKRIILEQEKTWENIQEAFFKQNVDTLRLLNKKLHNHIDKALSKKPKQFTFFHYHLEILRLMYGAISPMTGIIMGKKLKLPKHNL